MSPNENDYEDDGFTDRLAEFDAHLAEGTSSHIEAVNDDAEMQRAKACLEQLEALWPRQKSVLPIHSMPTGPGVTITSLDTLTDAPSLTQFGRFTIIRELGRGGGGVVYLAIDAKLKRQVALKIPRPDTLFTPSLRLRFMREAEAAAQLDHRHIVPIFEASESGGICYLVSAYCAGPNLGSWLRTRAEPVRARLAAMIVAALADGVAHMHKRGILHRDIKPSNVLMVTENSSDQELPFIPKLTDFGLAKLGATPNETNGEPADAMTHTGAILGTPAYMAPEQAEGQLDLIGPATDVYGLGTVLYELLAGKPPFSGNTDVALLQQVVSDEPRPVRRIRRDVPRDIETICLKCLEKLPSRRYVDAAALCDDLRRFLESRPINARPTSRLERTVKLVRRRPLMAVMALLILVATATSITLAFRQPAIVAKVDDQDTQVLRDKANALQWSANNGEYSKEIRKAWKYLEANEFAKLSDVLQASVLKAGDRDLRSFEWHYLSRLAKRKIVLRGHDATLNDIAFSPDGRLCATVDENPETKLIIWDLDQNRSIHKETLGFRQVGLFCFTADGSRLIVSVHNDDNDAVRIKTWEIPNAKPSAGYSFPWRPGHVSVSPDGKQFAGIFDPKPAFTAAELQVADTDNRRRSILKTKGVDLHRPCFSPDGKLIAVGHRLDKRLRAQLFDVANGVLVNDFEFEEGDHDFVEAFSFSHDGKQLAVGTNLGRGAIWNLSTNQVIRFREKGCISKLAIDPTGTGIVVRVTKIQSFTHSFYLRDVRTANLLRELTPKDFGARNFALSPKGGTIGLCGNDRLLHLQPMKGADAEHLPSPAPSGEAWSVAFSPKAKTLAVGYDNEEGLDAESFKLWDLVGKKAKVLGGHEGTVMAVAFSPDGETLASASFDKKVGLWNGASGKHLGWLEDHTKPVRTVVFSPDGRMLASAGSDGSIKLWNPVERKLIASWIAHTRPIRALRFSPDGRQLVSASNDEQVAVWAVQSRKHLFTLPDEDNVSCLAYSPDGKLLVTGNERFAIKVWNPAKGTLQHTLNGHTGKIRAIAFTSNGQTLATGGEDKLVRLWNVATCEELFALPTEHFINGLSFDDSGMILAAALHDGTTKIWSASRPNSNP